MRERVAGVCKVAGIVLLFALPVPLIIVWPPGPAPFLIGKTVGFRIGALLLFFVAMGYRTLKPEPLPVLVWVYAMFVAVTALADFTGIDPHRSFHGEWARLEGFQAPFSALLYLVGMTVFLGTAKLWHRFLAMWVVVGVIHAISGALQYADILERHSADNRVWGVAGQPVFLAMVLGFGMIFAAFLAHSSRSWSRAAWCAAIALQAVVLVLTGSRTALLGIVCAAIVVTGRDWLKWSPRAKNIAVLVAGLFALGTVSAIVLIEGFSDRVIASWGDCVLRFNFWHAEWVFIVQRPWLGWGQENLRVLWGTAIVDRAHNLFFEMMRNGGMILTLAYAAVLIVAWRTARRIPGRIVAIGGLVFYFVFEMMEPDAIGGAMAFVTVLGYIGWHGARFALPVFGPSRKAAA